MASSGYIVPFPLIYMTGAERSLLHVAERYLHVIRLSYPQLLEAQVQGFPPLHYIGVHTHILLAALGLPITLAENLLRNPEKWRNTGKFAEAVRRYLEAAASVAFFQEEYIPARPADRRRLLNPYLEKIFIYNLDVSLRCQFGAATPGIDWEEVEAEGQTILLDFSDELDPEMRRFKLLWVFSSLYEYIKRRGRREQPLSICIDEFSAMGNKVTEGTNPLATLLDEFIQQYLDWVYVCSSARSPEGKTGETSGGTGQSPKPLLYRAYPSGERRVGGCLAACPYAPRHNAHFPVHGTGIAAENLCPNT
jgi:hypothetical protein